MKNEVFLSHGYLVYQTWLDWDINRLHQGILHANTNNHKFSLIIREWGPKRLAELKTIQLLTGKP